MLLSLLCDCLVFFSPKELMIENRETTHCSSIQDKKRGSCSSEKMYYKIRIAWSKLSWSLMETETLHRAEGNEIWKCKHPNFSLGLPLTPCAGECPALGVHIKPTGLPGGTHGRGNEILLMDRKLQREIPAPCDLMNPWQRPDRLDFHEQTLLSLETLLKPKLSVEKLHFFRRSFPGQILVFWNNQTTKKGFTGIFL